LFHSENEAKAEEPSFLTDEDKQLLRRFKKYVEPIKLPLERQDKKWKGKLQTFCFDVITKNLERFLLHNGENCFAQLRKLIANFCI
jgi:hypothetical protein